MPRIYRAFFEDVSIAAAQDLLQLKGASGKMLRLMAVGVFLTNTTLATSQSIKTRCRVLPATVTDGSGGSTPTVQKTDIGDAAASASALANNTTKATSSGTPLVVDEGGAHIYNGYEKRWSRDNAPKIGPSQSAVFEMLSTVSGTVNMSGYMEFEEEGG